MSNLSYLPENINLNLTKNRNQGLKNLYFLSDIWDRQNGMENWAKLDQATKNLVHKKSSEEFEINIKYRLNETLKRLPKDTRTIVEDLFNAYYVGNFSPYLFGVYFDGKTFSEEIKNMTDAQIKKEVVRYWEAFTAVAMYGALDASIKNPKTNSDLGASQYTDAKHQLKNVVNYMRDNTSFYDFDTLKDNIPMATKQDIAEHWCYAGILQLIYEARHYRQVSIENMHTLNDASGAYKTPIQWLNKFNEQINRIEDSKNIKRTLN